MSSELTPSKRPHDEVEGEANGKGKLQKSDEYKHCQGSIVFRVVCPDSKSAKISEIHGANIRVEEAIPGCNERVVVIGKDSDTDDADKHEEDNDLQKALLLVFESMVDNDMDESIVVMRLLVVSTQVGCLLGKSKQMASESGAQIRILPKDKLPACASSLDELVEISGEVSSVRKAVEYFSQQLLEHPSNDSNTNTSISQQDTPHGRGGGGGGRFGNLTDMLTYRLICPDEKVGGVIGKGGAIVKALKHETGCDIKVLERIPGSDDRVIVISGPAVPNERICAPQDAVLRVQTRIFRAAPAPAPDTKGVTAKVIVSAHQIGCILGKGGSVISEMRKSTGAFIRILGKDQTPLYAAENQEVVQINGEFEAVQEALFQITTALRNHYFRDAFPGAYMGRGRSPPSFNRFDGGYGFHPHDDHPPPYIQRFPWGAPQGIEGGFSEFGGAPQRRMGGFGGGSHQAVITNTTVEVVVPRNVVSCIYGEDGGCLKQIREISDARITITDPKPGAKETLIVISGTPEQAHAAQSLIQAFVISETQVS